MYILYKSHISYMRGKYFLPIYGFAFQFLESVLSSISGSNFDEAELIFFFIFVAHAFVVFFITFILGSEVYV